MTAPPRRGWYHGWNIVGICILAQIAGNALTVSAFSLFLKDWSTAPMRPAAAKAAGNGRTPAAGRGASGAVAMDESAPPVA
jgi:hypothetical protein